MNPTHRFPDAERLGRHTYYRGRVALAQVLQCLDVGQGDEVLMQAFTCVANPEAVLAVGARPVYADLAPEGYSSGPAEVRARLTPNTRAIVVQHTFGLPAPIDSIVEIAAEWGVPVIEDCCHTLGGELGGRPLGGFGAAAYYSFEWGKPLVAGLGGAAVANSEDLDRRLHLADARLGLPGWTRRCKVQAQFWAFRLMYRPRWYWSVRAGFRALSRFGAAEGNYQDSVEAGPSQEFGWRMAPELVRRLESRARWIDRDAGARLANENGFRSALTDVAAPPPEDARGRSGPLVRLPLLVDDKPELLRVARAANVELADWYRTAIHPLDEDAARSIGYEAGSCPEAELRARQVVSLPLHEGVDQRFIDRAARVLGDAVRRQEPTTRTRAA